jgi:hypothetical protein
MQITLPLHHLIFCQFIYFLIPRDCAKRMELFNFLNICIFTIPYKVLKCKPE